MIDPQTTYQTRCATFAGERDRYASQSNRLSNLRLALFGGALAGLALVAAHSAWWWLGVAAALISFVGAVVRHHTIEQTRERFASLWAINDEGLRRLRRDWRGLPLRQAAPPADSSAIAGDLDLFGHASLAHLLGSAATPLGQATVRDWLLAPADPPTIGGRQAAVGELDPQIDFRDELAVRGRAVGQELAVFERFLAWCESPPLLGRRPWIIWIARVMPVITLAAIVTYFSGLTVVPWWLVICVLNLIIANGLGGAAERVIGQVAARQRSFGAFAALFGLINGQRFAAPLLRGLQADLGAGGLQADQQMARLGRLMILVDLRMSYFYIVLQALFLINIHTAWLLERWQQVAGGRVRRWMEVLGVTEALAALATLRHDHPGWIMPTIEPGGSRLEATALGHPLLPPAVAVRNDVAIGPPGTFLLVTGSNMSGKSTLLRALGVNAVLAQAGGPVCASALRMPPLTLATSVRVSDSLESGVSYFMAELLRLKWVIEVAEASQRTTLFLLDEILHGTNTAERQIAARQIIKQLLELDAMGAVSTHDLTLATADDIAAASQPFYFTEHFERGPDGPTMTFDYTLRPGLAPSTNALKLMEIIGLVEAER